MHLHKCLIVPLVAPSVCLIKAELWESPHDAKKKHTSLSSAWPVSVFYQPDQKIKPPPQYFIFNSMQQINWRWKSAHIHVTLSDAHSCISCFIFPDVFIRFGNRNSPGKWQKPIGYELWLTEFSPCWWKNYLFFLNRQLVCFLFCFFLPL